MFDTTGHTPTKKVQPNSTIFYDYLKSQKMSNFQPDIQSEDSVKTTIKTDNNTNTFYVVTDNVNETDTVNIEQEFISDINGNIIEEEEEEDIEHPSPSMKDNYVMQFYIGSLTIVGLFVLFRMIQKSK
jgi:hypothetical protein